MPDLDVSFMTSDPMLADTFNVFREAEGINNKGRTVDTETDLGTQTGVVTWEDPADLIKLPEGEMVPRRIFVATSFPIRGATAGFQPDVILYMNERYTVTRVMPYSRFGGGTYEVIATSMTAMDQPITASS